MRENQVSLRSRNEISFRLLQRDVAIKMSLRIVFGHYCYNYGVNKRGNKLYGKWNDHSIAGNRL
jgi:hypothetical protein